MEITNSMNICSDKCSYAILIKMNSFYFSWVKNTWCHNIFLCVSATRISKYLQDINQTYIFDYHGTITETLLFESELGRTGVGLAFDLFTEFPISPAPLGSQYSTLKWTAKDFEIVGINIDWWTNFVSNRYESGIVFM